MIAKKSMSWGVLVSTHFKYKPGQTETDSPAHDMPLCAVTAKRRNPRRRNFASEGAHNEDDGKEDAARVAAGRAQVSPDSQTSAKGVRRLAAGTYSDGYKRPDLDMPSTDW